MFGERHIIKLGRRPYIMPQETKDKISDAIKLSKKKNKPIKEPVEEPIKKMRLFDYIQKAKGNAYKKGSHRDLNYTVTGKQSPTTHQAVHPEWKVIK